MNKQFSAPAGETAFVARKTEKDRADLYAENAALSARIVILEARLADMTNENIGLQTQLLLSKQPH